MNPTTFKMTKSKAPQGITYQNLSKMTTLAKIFNNSSSQPTSSNKRATYLNSGRTL